MSDHQTVTPEDLDRHRPDPHPQRRDPDRPPEPPTPRNSSDHQTVTPEDLDRHRPDPHPQRRDPDRPPEPPTSRNSSDHQTVTPEDLDRHRPDPHPQRRDPDRPPEPPTPRNSSDHQTVTPEDLDRHRPDPHPQRRDPDRPESLELHAEYRPSNRARELMIDADEPETFGTQEGDEAGRSQDGRGQPAFEPGRRDELKGGRPEVDGSSPDDTADAEGTADGVVAGRGQLKIYAMHGDGGRALVDHRVGEPQGDANASPELQPRETNSPKMPGEQEASENTLGAWWSSDAGLGELGEQFGDRIADSLIDNAEDLGRALVDNVDRQSENPADPSADVLAGLFDAVSRNDNPISDPISRLFVIFTQERTNIWASWSIARAWFERIEK